MHRCVVLSLCGLLISQPLLLAAEKNLNFSTEELRSLYRSADSAMQSKDYGRARHYFRSLIRQGACQQLDSRDSVDLLLQLTRVEEEVGNYQEAISLLTEILQYELPEDQSHAAMMGLARSYQQAGEADHAQLVLNKLQMWEPSVEWSREERALLLSVKMSLHHHYSDLASQAERYLESGLYAEATPLYREILTAIDEGCYTLGDEDEEIRDRARLKLAECLFQRSLESDVVLLLKGIKGLEEPKSETGRRLLYLLGLAEMRLGRYADAISRFTAYIDLSVHETGQWEDAEWERAVCLYKLGHLPAAEGALVHLVREGKRPRLVQLAQVYRARIQLETGQYRALEATLELLSAATPSEDTLLYEIHYLKGESAFRRDDFLTSARHFEEALPKRNQQQADWYPNALYHLAWSYLKLGDDSGQESSSQATYLGKAEHSFKQLVALSREDRAYLGLARVYLAQSQRLGDREAGRRVESLLSKPELFSSPDSKAEALLLRTEALRDFTVREALYRELTDTIYEGTASYPDGWYARGLNHFGQGEQLRRNGDHLAALRNYQVAAQELIRAFELLNAKGSAKAGLALKFAAQAHYNQNTPESHRLAFEILNSLLTDHSKLLGSMEHVDEVFYLRGLMASVLLRETDDHHYLEAAEWSLSHLVAENPTSRFASSALHVLATMHFHRKSYSIAETIFVQLATDYPESQYAGDAWFWAAESAERERKESKLVREYRQRVYQRYPNSFFAAEAYFNAYSFSEYLQGDREAMDHLKKMEDRYPINPYLVVSHYLTGLDLKLKDPSLATKLFDKSVEMFEQCYRQGLIFPASLDYFATTYYRSRLEGALTRLTMAGEPDCEERNSLVKEAEKLLKGAIAELSSPEHPLASLLSREQDYTRILEEAYFGLARLSLVNKDDIAAEETLQQMLGRYQDAKTVRGYYLSRVCYELGRIAMRRGEYAPALNFLNRAEDSAKQGVLSREQQLDLWLQMSMCYRAQGMLDEAMLALSRVINDDSTLGLRVQAMYLRAEIYELQGRHELALKQLEATSRKGGTWAAKATEKMRRDYGFN
jgi:tetratricopeptide (TPR) repeat protein